MLPCFLFPLPFRGNTTRTMIMWCNTTRDYTTRDNTTRDNTTRTTCRLLSLSLHVVRSPALILDAVMDAIVIRAELQLVSNSLDGVTLTACLTPRTAFTCHTSNLTGYPARMRALYLPPNF